MSALRPQPRPGVLDIEAYVPGESNVPGGMKPIKLSSNETPLGASPRAIDAYKSVADKLELYPDGSSSRLRDTIGARYGLDPSRIICGAGSDELLSLITNAYIGPGDEGIFTAHGFLVYKIAIQAAGGVPVVAEEKDERVLRDADCNSRQTFRAEYCISRSRPSGSDGRSRMAQRPLS